MDTYVPEKVSSARASVTSAFDTGSTQGLLTVATSVSFAQWYLAPALPRFLKAHPGARVRIASTIWPDNFHASIADVEIRFGSEALVGKGAERLLPDEIQQAAEIVERGHEIWAGGHSALVVSRWNRLRRPSRVSKGSTRPVAKSRFASR